MKKNSLKAGRPRVAQKWATKMVHSLYLSFEDDRDLHTLLYIAGVDSLDTIKRALREYIANHNHHSGDPAFQAEVAARALGISIGTSQSKNLQEQAINIVSKTSNAWEPSQAGANDGLTSQSEILPSPITPHSNPNNSQIPAQKHEECSDHGNDNLASRWLSE